MSVAAGAKLATGASLIRVKRRVDDQSLATIVVRPKRARLSAAAASSDGGGGGGDAPAERLTVFRRLATVASAGSDVIGGLLPAAGAQPMPDCVTVTEAALSKRRKRRNDDTAVLEVNQVRQVPVKKPLLASSQAEAPGASAASDDTPGAAFDDELFNSDKVQTGSDKAPPPEELACNGVPLVRMAVDDGYVYDYYAASVQHGQDAVAPAHLDAAGAFDRMLFGFYEDRPLLPADEAMLRQWSDDECGDDDDNAADDEDDSNAEDNAANDYPDEEDSQSSASSTGDWLRCSADLGGDDGGDDGGGDSAAFERGARPRRGSGQMHYAPGHRHNWRYHDDSDSEGAYVDDDGDDEEEEENAEDKKAEGDAEADKGANGHQSSSSTAAAAGSSSTSLVQKLKQMALSEQARVKNRLMCADDCSDEEDE